MINKRAFMALGTAAGLTMLGAGTVGATVLAGSGLPAELDRSLDRPTLDGAFRIRIEPAEQPIPLRRIHRWSVAVTDRGGQPVVGAVIRVDGGMPQHGHGLPTKPVAAPAAAPGTYTINGLKFSMDGWWELKLAVSAGGVTDRVTFNIVL